MKDQKDIEKEHLEAIEETVIIDRRLLLLLKRKHSRITKKRMDIARLDGFLEAIKMAGDGKITAEVVDIAIEELEQLKNGD